MDFLQIRQKNGINVSSLCSQVEIDQRKAVREKKPALKFKRLQLGVDFESLSTPQFL